MFTKPTGMESSFAFNEKLADEELNKVTGGEGYSEGTHGLYYCSKVEDDNTFKKYYSSGGQDNGCPHWAGKSEGADHLCEGCDHLLKTPTYI